jgi:transcriptional regulator with XRE-family HTH domain
MSDLSDRLRQAREYIGFTREAAAAALKCSPMLVTAMEVGTADPGPEMLEKLAVLYRRPVGWFTGEWEFRPGPDMVRQLNENPRLTEGDREAVLDFAEFLAGAGPAPKSKRDRA